MIDLNVYSKPKMSEVRLFVSKKFGSGTVALGKKFLQACYVIEFFLYFLV